MSDLDKIDAKRIALTTLIVASILALAALAYFLIDIIILLFLGIVLAASLHPWHRTLVGWGIPTGAAVLLIYGVFLVILVGVGLTVGPVLVEQATNSATQLPDAYNRMRAMFSGGAPPLRMIGERMPSFERLAPAFTTYAPNLFTGLVGFTTTLFGLFAYVLSVLAIAFYWTMELPRVERLVLSFVPVGRRTNALSIWHEIEGRLGSYMRAQGMAMLAIGVASGIAYWLIGLPNVFVLAVLAGLLEAVPMIGPILAAVPALLIALPLGWPKVVAVVVASSAIQAFENNVLIPRLMSQAVGVSSLVGLIAVLAFGVLYGVLGVFIAIPMTAAIQVVLDRLIINAEPVTEIPVMSDPWANLRARVRTIRQRARERMRARESRIGIDPENTDHVIDAVDQQIEQAVERVEKMIAAASDGQLPHEERTELVEGLHEAAEHIEEAADKVDTLVATTATGESPSIVALPVEDLVAATEQVEKAVERVENVMVTTQETPGPIEAAERDAIVENLDEATHQIKDAVKDVDSLVTAAKDESRKRTTG
jgi:predicted PurR-regulated permease PerM